MEMNHTQKGHFLGKFLIAAKVTFKGGQCPLVTGGIGGGFIIRRWFGKNTSNRTITNGQSL